MTVIRFPAKLETPRADPRSQTQIEQDEHIADTVYHHVGAAFSAMSAVGVTPRDAMKYLIAISMRFEGDKPHATFKALYADVRLMIDEIERADEGAMTEA